MARPIIHHRAPEYDALFREVREALKRLVQTREDVLTPACTGTAPWRPPSRTRCPPAIE